MTKQEELRVYYIGVMEGITRYAWWRDGVQYVGTTGQTLKDALRDVEKEYQEQCEYEL